MVAAGWVAELPARVVGDLGYVRAWSGQQRAVVAEIAGELAFFGEQAPARRSVLGFTSEPSGRLLAPGPDGLVAPEVHQRRLLLAAARTGALIEDSGRPVPPGTEAGDAVRAMLAARRWALVPSGRHDFRSDGRRDPAIAAVVPVSPRLGRISGFGAGYPVCFNSGYYVWLEEEFADGYASSGDPIGLEVVDGVVTSPPTVSRSALLRVLDATGTDRLVVRRVDVADLTVTLPGGVVVHGRTAGCRCPRTVDCLREEDDPVELLTRGRGADAVVAVPAGATAVTLYGRQVCRVASERTECPANGLVVLLREPAATRVRAGCATGSRVVYDLVVDGARVLSGSQVGPAMLRDGDAVDVAAEIGAELETYRPASEVGVSAALPPVALTAEKLVAEHRGRAAVGITPAGDVHVLAVEGCEPRSLEPGVDVAGVGLREMTEVLRDRGCTEAVALDSGGAANICYRGTLAVRPADRNDVIGIPFERFVPGAWRLAGPPDDVGWTPAG